MPDFFAYHRSLTDEIYSLKNRIRDLVDHWGTDGEHKEIALKSILRRHLPESIMVGRGFIVTSNSASTQIDVLLVDRDKPTLFKDGDLIIVTPDAVRAVIEVKTTLSGPQTIAEAMIKLAQNAKLCREIQSRQQNMWVGLFVYESKEDFKDKDLLKGIAQAYTTTEWPINCISYGKNMLIRHWNIPGTPPVSVWHSYMLHNMAPAYFVGNVVDSISSVNQSSSIWFPYPDGKENKRISCLSQGVICRQTCPLISNPSMDKPCWQ